MRKHCEIFFSLSNNSNIKIPMKTMQDLSLNFWSFHFSSVNRLVLVQNHQINVLITSNVFYAVILMALCWDTHEYEVVFYSNWFSSNPKRSLNTHEKNTQLKRSIDELKWFSSFYTYWSMTIVVHSDPKYIQLINIRHITDFRYVFFLLLMDVMVLPI